MEANIVDAALFKLKFRLDEEAAAISADEQPGTRCWTGPLQDANLFPHLSAQPRRTIQPPALTSTGDASKQLGISDINDRSSAGKGMCYDVSKAKIFLLRRGHK